MSSLVERLALVALALTPACSAADPNPVCADGARCIDARATDASTDATLGDADANSPEDLVSVAVVPATATITTTDGAPATQAFQLMGTQRDGRTRVLGGVTWSTDPTPVGQIDGASGTFTATGIAGGAVTVTGAVPHGATTLSATATLTVRVVRTLTPAGVSPSVFGGTSVTDATREAGLLYPLAAALMPNNVAPPDLQWQHGAMGDVFRVVFSKADLTATAYVPFATAGFTNDWLVDATMWQSIVETDPGTPVYVTVDRYEAASTQVIRGTPRAFTVARRGIFGAVYFWAVDEGQLRTIRAGAASSAPVMMHPPPVTPGDLTAPRCIACHTISRDGRYLAGSLRDDTTGQYGAAVFDLTDATVATADPAPTLARSPVNYQFGAFNPDSSRLLTSCFMPSASCVLGLIDPRSGASVAATGLPGTVATHGDWAPDNSAIAFVGVSLDSYSFSTGDLTVAPVTGPDAFGAANVIHHGADLAGQPEMGSADAHPTFAPDAHLIAFQHGPRAYSHDPDPNATGALYVIAPAGGAAIRLDNASASERTPQSFWPTFSPFVTTENGHSYYWLAYFSRRDYGNAQAGTQGTSRRQLWVTAVDASPTPGTDPSHVPFWLPGQETSSDNAAAFWAPVACRPNAGDCTSSSECCSERCVPDPTMPGHTTCQPAMTCRTEGMTCGGAGDCCGGLMCVSGTCVAPPG